MANIAATIYLIYVLHKSEIAKPMRVWMSKRSTWALRFFSCPYCLSFWCAGVVYLSPVHLSDILGLAGMASFAWLLWGKWNE